MTELVRFIARSLVDTPDAVDVREVDSPDATVIELRVAPEDMGKVIGSRGASPKQSVAIRQTATAQGC